MKTIALEPNDVPSVLKIGYSGCKFEARVCESITPHSMQWEGGTRSTYTAVNLGTGERRPITDKRPWPQNMSAAPSIDLEPGWVIVEHVIFCGKDLGLHYHVHPQNAAALLPKPADDLTEAQITVLGLTARLIPKARREYAARKGIDAQMWDATVAELAATGYLRKNGSITPKGRNAVPSDFREF